MITRRRGPGRRRRLRRRLVGDVRREGHGPGARGGGDVEGAVAAGVAGREVGRGRRRGGERGRRRAVGGGAGGDGGLGGGGGGGGGGRGGGRGALAGRGDLERERVLEDVGVRVQADLDGVCGRAAQLAADGPGVGTDAAVDAICSRCKLVDTEGSEDGSSVGQGSWKDILARVSATSNVLEEAPSSRLMEIGPGYWSL